MFRLTDTELERMQATQVQGLHDKCIILRFIEGNVDEYGKPVRSWVADSDYTECGFDTRGSAETMGKTQTQAYDARLRLPYGTVISRLDRVQITHRFESELDTPINYEMIGNAFSGPSGLRVDLVEVNE